MGGNICCRGLRGPCGLKYRKLLKLEFGSWSRPVRALWIEISASAIDNAFFNVEACEGLVD